MTMFYPLPQIVLSCTSCILLTINDLCSINILWRWVIILLSTSLWIDVPFSISKCIKNLGLCSWRCYELVLPIIFVGAFMSWATRNATDSRDHSWLAFVETFVRNQRCKWPKAVAVERPWTPNALAFWVHPFQDTCPRGSPGRDRTDWHTPRYKLCSTDAVFQSPSGRPAELTLYAVPSRELRRTLLKQEKEGDQQICRSFN